MSTTAVQPSPVPSERPRRLEPDERGSAFVEYVILVACVGFVLTLMFIDLGPRVVAEYSARRGALYSHSP